jgi:hypothetical protein
LSGVGEAHVRGVCLSELSTEWLRVLRDLLHGEGPVTVLLQH